MQPVYLDYNATTPLDPAVREAMRPYIEEHFGNPSSNHYWGQQARQAVEEARAKVAASLGCSAEEIIFTSGGSESNNTVLKGVAYTYRERGNHIITSQIEHPAILQPCRFLEQNGYRITYLPVDRYGWVDPEAVRRAITPDTILISIMHANNEVGTVEPIETISALARERNILVHTDAAQSVGKIPVDVERLGVDFLSVAGHKLYAPKGIGALYIRKGIRLEPLIHGAGHERGLRAGTENVIFAVALGEACTIAHHELERYQREVKALRDYFHQELLKRLGERVVLNGHPEKRLPNTLNVSFVGTNGAELLARVPEIAASTGSACHDGKISLSPVLQAMGIAPETGQGAVRFSLGRWTTREEIDLAVAALERAIR